MMPSRISRRMPHTTTFQTMDWCACFFCHHSRSNFVADKYNLSSEVHANQIYGKKDPGSECQFDFSCASKSCMLQPVATVRQPP